MSAPFMPKDVHIVEGRMARLLVRLFCRKISDKKTEGMTIYARRGVFYVVAF